MRIVVLSLLSMLAAVPLWAQGPGSGALDLSAAEIQAMVKLAVNNPMKSIDAGKHTVFFEMETREKSGKAGNGIPHADITAIYLIVEGAATLRTGGQLASAYKLYDGGR